MLFRLVTKFQPSSATPLSSCQSFQAIRFKIVPLLVLLYFSLNNVFDVLHPVQKVIMIAAGSGIAPFRSFWQERQRQAQVGHDPPIIVSLSNPCSMFRLLGLLVQLSFSLAADGRAWTCWEKKPISSGPFSSSANNHLFVILFQLIIIHHREDEKGWFGRCFPRRAHRWVKIKFPFFFAFTTPDSEKECAIAY